MLMRRIIPCFDVADGRVVKGVSFVELRDAASNQGRLEELTGALDYNPAAKYTLEAKLAARTTIPANKPGTFSVEASWQPSADPKAGALGSGGGVAGRTNVVVGHPSNPAIAWIGSDGGGVWKTTNCCDATTTWRNTTDISANTEVIQNSAIGDLTLDPNYPRLTAINGLQNSV